MDTVVLLIVAGAAILMWELWQRKVAAQADEPASAVTRIEQVVTEIQALQQRLGSAADRGDYSEAIHISERMLVLSDDHFRDDPDVILPLLAALANFHHLADQPREAIPYLQRSIQLREQFPALHNDQADSLSQLADLHIELGTRGEALTLIRREVELRRRHTPPNEALLAALCKLLSLNLEEPAMAQPLRRDISATAAILKQEVVAKMAHEASINVSHLLGEGNVRAAWSAAETAALLGAAAHGPEDDITFIYRGNLAEVLRRNGHLEEAETQFLQLITDEGKRENGAEGLHAACGNLALLYDQCGRPEDAAQMRARQMELLQESDANTGSRFNALNNLAVSQSSAGDHPTAANTFANALALAPEGDGIDPRVWADTLNNYASTLINLKRLSDAGRIYQKVLERKKAGIDIPITSLASSVNGLGVVSEQLGKLAQAQTLFERALAIKEKHLPTDAIALETARHNLGSVYARRGNTAQAIQMAQQVLASREQRLGQDHPQTNLARQNLELVSKDLPATRADVDTLMVDITGGQLFPYATYDFGRARDTGISMVLVPETQALTLHRKLKLALPHGWQCFIGSTRWLGEENHDGMAELVSIQAESQFDCLLAARTDAVNHGLDTAGIIRTLQDYDQRFGIRIYSASTDTVGFTLLRAPADLDAFAQELLDFCMDLEDVELIRQMITASGNRVELWWD